MRLVVRPELVLSAGHTGGLTNIMPACPGSGTSYYGMGQFACPAMRCYCELC
jgi:hypothetical protein